MTSPFCTQRYKYVKGNQRHVNEWMEIHQSACKTCHPLSLLLMYW
jgi:hypothetical protein